MDVKSVRSAVAGLTSKTPVSAAPLLSARVLPAFPNQDSSAPHSALSGREVQKELALHCHLSSALQIFIITKMAFCILCSNRAKDVQPFDLSTGCCSSGWGNSLVLSFCLSYDDKTVPLINIAIVEPLFSSTQRPADSSYRKCPTVLVYHVIFSRLVFSEVKAELFGMLMQLSGLKVLLELSRGTGAEQHMSQTAFCTAVAECVIDHLLILFHRSLQPGSHTLCSFSSFVFHFSLPAFCSITGEG
ncbi:hypothetical protein SRHO_G00136920 [Serrasalmus rhombeus]